MAIPYPSMISAPAGLLIADGTFNQTIVQSAGHQRGLELLANSASPTAFHNSGHEFDSPKCHPNTRVAVQNRIKDWIRGKEERDALFMWLYGGAGAGKSAISRSIAEWCESQGILLASFFFGRTDPARNGVERFVATLSYDVARSLLPSQPIINSIVETDPHIFTSTLDRQFSRLILEPLSQLSQTGTADPLPHVIIIDGLDECTERTEQKALLRLLSSFDVDSRRLGLKLLVASRPEHAISAMFDSPPLKAMSRRIALSNQRDSDDDIRKFLEDKFAEIRLNHPRRAFIPADWPSIGDIDMLVQKSSGHFIYAATVVKHVQSERHKPTTRLTRVLGLGTSPLSSADRDLPFAELDSLYTHIISTAPVEDVTVTGQVLALCLLVPQHCANPWYSLTVDDLETIAFILKLEVEEVHVVLAELGAIVEVGKTEIRMLHASFEDFLFDPIRSGHLWVYRIGMLNEIATRLLEKLENGYGKRSFIWKAPFAVFPKAEATPRLIQALQKVDLKSVLAQYDAGHDEHSLLDLNRAVTFFASLVATLRVLAADLGYGQEIYQQQFSVLVPWIKGKINGYLIGSDKLRALITLYFSDFTYSTWHIVHLGSLEIQYDFETLGINAVSPFEIPHLGGLEAEVKTECQKMRNLLCDGRAHAAGALLCVQFLLCLPQMASFGTFAFPFNTNSYRSRRSRPWLWRKRTLSIRSRSRNRTVKIKANWKILRFLDIVNQHQADFQNSWDIDAVNDQLVEKILSLLPELLERASKLSRLDSALVSVLLYGHAALASFEDWPENRMAIKSYLARTTRKLPNHRSLARPRPTQSPALPQHVSVSPQSKVDVKDKLMGYESLAGTTATLMRTGLPAFHIGEFWKVIQRKFPKQDTSDDLSDID